MATQMAVCRKSPPRNGTPFAFLRQKPKGVPNPGGLFLRRIIFFNNKKSTRKHVNWRVVFHYGAIVVEK